MHVREWRAGRYCGAACGCLFLLLLGVGAAAPAADPAPSRGLLAAERGSPEWKALVADGRSRADFCARCHGEDGNSTAQLVPNLAGQSPAYLLEQIEKFADGRRKDFIMTPLARQFSQEDKVALVYYYANMPARAHAADPALVGPGAVLYGQRCIACHGPDAHGGDLYARLAGQHPDYLKRRLAGFREATGGAISVMTEIARTLTERDIEQITAYLSSRP